VSRRVRLSEAVEISELGREKYSDKILKEIYRRIPPAPCGMNSMCDRSDSYADNGPNIHMFA